MVIAISFNGRLEDIASVETLGEAMNRFDKAPRFELFESVAGGPSLCILRNGANAWLMCLCREGDAGFHSVGQLGREGTEKYLLSNGQEDEYPLAWCIELEQCYKAFAYFYVNEGARPEWIHWHET